MDHVDVGHRWDRVAMDLLDMSVTTAKGNRYMLVMVDCFSRWTEVCPLPDKTALSVADAFFQHIVCRFGMPVVIHSDQGRKFENKVMQELCLLCGSHKARTTPYHPESDGLVERQKRLYDRRAVQRLFAVGDWVLCYYPPAKKCKLDSAWVGPYLVVSSVGWALGIQRHPDSPIVLVHCQDLKKFPSLVG